MTMRDKELIEARRSCLVEATGSFCREFVNDEYADLCKRLIDKMARKRTVPFLTGRLEIWAAAVLYAIGQINFLFDKSFEPYMSSDDVCGCFGANETTVSGKAKSIRDMFKMNYYDEEFSTQHMRENNPLKDLVMIDGLIVPKKFLPPDILRVLEEQ